MKQSVCQFYYNLCANEDNDCNCKKPILFTKEPSKEVNSFLLLEHFYIQSNNLQISNKQNVLVGWVIKVHTVRS